MNVGRQHIAIYHAAHENVSRLYTVHRGTVID